MKKITALFLLLAVVSGCRSGKTVSRTFDLAHMSPENAQLLVEPYVPGGTANCRRTDNPPALTVTATPDRLEQIADLLERYDKPSPAVRLRFQVIEGDGFTNPDTAIAAVEGVLRELFKFEGYRLAAESLMNARAFSSNAQALMGPNEIPLLLEVEVHRVIAVEGKKAVELKVTLRGYGLVMLATQVTVPAGQTVVLGTANPDPKVKAMILVVRPEID